jgi:sec-independent protein translocase protein TatB
MADSIILMILALVVFGPRRLPQIGRQIGKLMFEFRKASNDFKFQMEEELRAAEDADRRKREEAERQRVAALAAQSQASVSAPAQPVESSADIGAVEPPATPGHPDQYSLETPSATPAPAESGPVIQPPQTGEQVSTSPRPDYYFEGSETTEANATAMAEVNPDADAEANAEGVAAISEAAPAVAESQSSSAPVPIPENQSPTPAKEPVSQHG